MENKETITSKDFFYLIIGIEISVSIASLPNYVSTYAKNDGWISAAMGAIYPLYIALITIFISNKYPNDNILTLSKKYLGNKLGKLLNFLFLISFFSFFPSVMAFMYVLNKEYIVPFIVSPSVIYIPTLFIAAYGAMKGLKTVAKISKVVFYILLFLCIIPIFLLKEGDILNICPIFKNGAVNILKSGKDAVLDYSLIEFSLLIYPFVDDKTKIKPTLLKTVLVQCILYTWVTFITIYYMGTELISKSIFSFIIAIESVRIDIVNNFRYVFSFFWTIVVLKSITIFYYLIVFILDDLRNKKSGIFTYFIIGIVAMFLASKYYNTYLDKKFIIDITVKYAVGYNIFYITLIFILILLKRNETNEKGK